MKITFEDCEILAKALAEYAANHHKERVEVDALADRVVAHQSSVSEA